MSNNPHQKEPAPGLVSRREVLEVAGGAAAAGALAACGPKPPQNICEVAICVEPDMASPVPACTIDSFTVADADTLAVGQVRIISSEETILVRQADGFAVMSTKCRHAGCTVAYKSNTQSFDCPCHGSRYRLDGSVLRAPADTPQLPPLLYRATCRQNGLLTISRTNYVKDATLVK
jgi:Rieske Fe-S protein